MGVRKSNLGAEMRSYSLIAILPFLPLLDSPPSLAVCINSTPLLLTEDAPKGYFALNKSRPLYAKSFIFFALMNASAFLTHCFFHHKIHFVTMSAIAALKK